MTNESEFSDGGVYFSESDKGTSIDRNTRAGFTKKDILNLRGKWEGLGDGVGMDGGGTACEKRLRAGESIVVRRIWRRPRAVKVRTTGNKWTCAAQGGEGVSGTHAANWEWNGCKCKTHTGFWRLHMTKMQNLLIIVYTDYIWKW